MRYALLLLPLAVLTVRSYLYAYALQVCWTEMSTVFLLVPFYLWLDASGRCRLSLLASPVLFLWFYLEVLGACYTFERVPFDFMGGCSAVSAIAVVAIMALAKFRELVEWLYAEWNGGTAGAAFLGSQGDVWDIC